MYVPMKHLTAPAAQEDPRRADVSAAAAGNGKAQNGRDGTESTATPMTENERIDAAAARILAEYREAFEELAK